MPGSSRNHRVFLLYKGVLREFLWFSYGADQSLYFGSLHKKAGQIGSSSWHPMVPGGAVASDIPREFLSEEDARQKNSIHASGVMYVPGGPGKLRTRWRVNPLKDYKDFLPIVTVFPSDPAESMKETKKTPREIDFVIDLSRTGHAPTAMIFFMSKEQYPKLDFLRKQIFQILSTAKIRTASIPFGDQFLMCIYYSSPKWGEWPTLEKHVVTYPETVGAAHPFAVLELEHRDITSEERELLENLLEKQPNN